MTASRMTRRTFCGALAAAPAGWAVAAQRPGLPAPNEDLMREHGLVGRAIGIYGRAARLLEAGRTLDPGIVMPVVQLVQAVIHGHHEVEEERIVFPLAEARGLQMLVEVLRGQHRAARTLTATIGNNLTTGRIDEPARVQALVKAMREFSSMYAPHGNFEDTVVYPAFREAAGADRYAELAEVFARDERALEERIGYEESLKRLAAAEDALGISLAAYTEQVEAATSVPRRPPR